MLREDADGLTAYVGAIEVHISATERVTTSYYFVGGQRVAMRRGGEVTYLHGDHLGSASLATDATGVKISDMRYRPFGETRYGDAPTDRRFTGQREESSLGLYDYNARFYSAGLGRFLSADSIVPGTASGFGDGAATLGYDRQTRLTPLTVHLGEFVAQINAENREVLQFGAFSQWDSRTRQQYNVPTGPLNPQALNRYAYCLNNPLGYIDPTGHSATSAPPPPWLQDILVVWRNAPRWVRQLFFNNPTGGTRIFQIDGPHTGAKYWHINSDLQLLGDKWLGLHHKNIEPFFDQIASGKDVAKATLQSILDFISTTAGAIPTAIQVVGDRLVFFFDHVPMIIVFQGQLDMYGEFCWECEPQQF